MKRFYICKKVGTGTDDDPIRPKAMDYDNASVSAYMASNRNWCLAIVAAADHTDIAADPECFQLPDLSLDIKLSTLPTAIRSAALTKLTQVGLPVSVTTNDTFRVLLRHIAANLVSDFNEDRFDVKEPE
jgi:hypothetical protein